LDAADSINQSRLAIDDVTFMATDSTAVIDIGSHTVKAGVSLHFPQESAPEVVCLLSSV